MNSILKIAISISVFVTSSAKASDWSQAKNYSMMSVSRENFKSIVDPVYQEVFSRVDQAQLMDHLKKLSGSAPVTVNGETYSISERYSPGMKAKFRAFWRQYFTDLGIANQEMAYKTRHKIGETQGHNLEAVIPGQSKDSVVIIVHYDSMGPKGHETENPGVDDDMTGMAIMLETARILSMYPGHLKNTVRFVAADYEEQTGPKLEGARQYAKYIKEFAAANSFKIVAAVDNEQSGWNCISDGTCSGQGKAPAVDVFSCSGGLAGYSYPKLGDLYIETVSSYSSLQINRGCIGENSDHYAMWEIGVPAVVFSEHNPFDNPHFDNEGGDTLDKIDMNYFFQIAQVGVTFAARMIELQ